MNLIVEYSNSKKLFPKMDAEYLESMGYAHSLDYLAGIRKYRTANLKYELQHDLLKQT